MHRHNRHGHGRFGGFPEAIFAMGMNMGGRGRGGGWGFEEWGEWGGRRGGRGRMFGSGELRLVLLKLIADEPRHGYDLIRAIEELTGGSYAPSPGVVYPTLSMLEDEGLVEAQATEGARKAFAATAEGQAHLAEKSEEIDALFERLSGHGDRHRKRGKGPVKRSIGNLLAVLAHTFLQDEVDEEKAHQVAAIIDEAAQKIERL